MSGGRIELSLERKPGGSRRGPGRRPNLLVIVHRPVSTGAASAVQPLDFDNVDATLASALGQATADTVILGHPYTAEIAPVELESFDPGAIAGHFPVLDTLNGLCRELRVPSRAAGARQRLAELLQMEAEPPRPQSASAPSPRSDFARLLGSTAGPATRESDQADRLVRTLVGDAAELTPQRDETLIDAVEEVRLQALRRALASPDLHRLERTWRAVHWLVSSIDPEEGVRPWLVALDVASLREDGAEREAGLDTLRNLLRRHQVLGESGADAIVVDYDFDSPQDLGSLEALGQLAADLGTTVFAAAPRVLGETVEEARDTPLAVAWQSLRRTQAAAHIAAAHPRLLMRLPYGQRGESCDVDGFEELEAAPDHEAFLWGNPAYGLARLLSRGWERDRSWPPDVSLGLELEGMPLAVYDDGTGDAIKPPGERFLDERDAARLAALGIMSMQSFRNGNAVRLSAFHTLSG